MRKHVASHTVTHEKRTIHAVAHDIHDTSKYGVTVHDLHNNVMVYVPADVIRDMAKALAAEQSH